MSDAGREVAGRRGLLTDLAQAWLAAPVLLRWSLPLAMMVALWWSSSRTPTPGEPWLFGEVLHNAMHVVAYGALGGAVWFASRDLAAPAPGLAAAWIAFAVATAYGIVDELHQAATPGRVSSIYDVMSDASGAALVVHVLRRWLGDVKDPAVWYGLVLACAAACSVVLATFG